MFDGTSHILYLVLIFETFVKMFWILLTLSLVCADKLDRTYLPPSGSQYAGGRPEYIKAPFEYSEINYPGNPNFIDNKEIAIGIDRKGPKEISDTQKNNAFSDRTFPQSKDVVSTTVGSLKDFDYIPKYSLNANPDIMKFQNDQNEQKYTIQNIPEKYLPNNQNYPAKIVDKNIYANTLKPITSTQYVTTSPQENRMNGDLDGFIRQPCNSSLVNSLGYGPCTINNESNQYSSTGSPGSVIVSSTSTPTTVVPNYSEYHSSRELQNNVNRPTATAYSSTTKTPFINYDNKRPERIQSQSDREAVIINYDNVLTPEGYSYSFDTSNGIHGDESGVTLDGTRAVGSYSYIGDDGKIYRVTYTADENGFRPEGDHLPTSPPIPDAILKVIEKAYEDKKAGIIDDGSYDENKYGHKKYQKDFYKPNLYGLKNNQKTINEDLNTEDNTPFSPKKGNVDLQITKDKQNDVFINNKQATRPKYMNDDYKEIDDGANNDETDYQKFSSMKSTPKTMDDEFNKSTLINGNNISNEQNNFSPTNKSQTYNISSSPYYVSQNENKFPTRFSDIYNEKNKKIFQKNTEDSPKPFMTPYVSRSDNDELQSYDSKEKIYDEPSHHFNYDSHHRYNNGYYPTDEERDNYPTREQSETSNNSEKNDFKLSHDGYFYPKALNSDDITLKQFSDPNLSYTSTYRPFKFSTRPTIANIGKYYTGTPQISFRSSTIPSLKETSTDYQTSTFPSYSPNFEYKNVIGEIKEPSYLNNGAPSTEKNIGTNIPKFAPSYSPNIDIVSSDTFKSPSTTEKIVGEDFSGPKRPQSFNPLTGYQY